MVKFLLSLAWAFSHRLDKTILGSDYGWGGVQYLLISLMAGVLSLFLGFGGGVAFGLGMIVVAVCDQELIENGLPADWQDPLLMRVGIYAYATLLVTLPVALMCILALELEAIVVAGFATRQAFLHQPGLFVSGFAGDVVGLVLGCFFFLCLDTKLLGLITDRLGYAVSADGTVIRK
jgi:hypothetical protein